MPRRREIDEREVTAYHEAGHAAMGLWLGVPFQSMSIIGDERSDGRVTPQLHRWFRPAVVHDRYHHEYVELECQILFAGPEAERRILGRYNHEGAAVDTAEVFRLAMREHYADRALNAFVKWLNEAARETTSDPRYWEVVETLASALLVSEQLNYRRARRLVGDAAAQVRRWPKPPRGTPSPGRRRAHN